jgi:hypothetical protein
LKVLPDSFAADPERVARFEREAQLLAALNHRTSRRSTRSTVAPSASNSSRVRRSPTV